MLKTLIIYHKEDNDGVFSCALVKNLYNIAGNAPESVDTWGVTYNDLNELWDNERMDDKFNAYHTVVIADVSFNNPHAMLWLKKHFGKSLLWFDHHKPIINASKDYSFDDITGLRSVDQSALMCVWQFLYDPELKHVPNILQILSDWDSWQWHAKGLDRKKIESVNVGITHLSNLSVDWVMSHIKEFTSETDDFSLYTLAKSTGDIILEHNHNRYGRIVEEFGDCSWTVAGHKGCMLSTQESTGSYVFDILSGSEVRHGIVFKHCKDGKWVVSIYNIDSDDDFDCGAYLRQKYNGGGHKGAAGCTITEEQFIDILQRKEL